MKVIVKPTETVEKLAKTPERLVVAASGCSECRDLPCGRNSR